jgi:deoxyribodipyrimidine photo-lyase
MSFSPSSPVHLLWLRRDLRLYDAAPLAKALHAGGLVQPVFVFDTDVLARFTHPDDRRLSFIMEALHHLHEEWRKKGGGLLVLHGKAETLIPRLAYALQAFALFAGLDYEPSTRARDRRVGEALEGKTTCHFINDHTLIAPEDALKADGSPYRVYTPYAKLWRAQIHERDAAAEAPLPQRQSYADYQATLQAAAAHHLPVIDLEQGAKAALAAIGYHLQPSLYEVRDARGKLHDFMRARIHHYAEARDYMDQAGTSRLSLYLRFGLISVREALRLASAQARQGQSKGAATWIGELAWRDFYIMLLYHFPETAQEEFQPQYRGLPWRRDRQDFQRFAEGRTGYPVIDAAMRQLLETGFMHNRARMIVASFMTKDLLLDWRLGEEHFAQYLMDYELASNVGGWQWAASVGTDAQPYFRVFNPVEQGKKFDPQGDYIKRFVPELRALSRRDIPMPTGLFRPKDYPAPIVDHAQARERALAFFRAHRSERAA